MRPRIWVTLAGLATVALIVWILYFYVGESPLSVTYFPNDYAHALCANALGCTTDINVTVPECTTLGGSAGADSSSCPYQLAGVFQTWSGTVPANATLCIVVKASGLHVCLSANRFDLAAMMGSERAYAGVMAFEFTSILAHSVNVTSPIGVS